MKFGAISGRNVLSRLTENKAVLPLIKSRLEDDGECALIETIPSLSSRLSDFAQGELKEELLKCEGALYSSENPLFSWSKAELEAEVKSTFEKASISYKEMVEPRFISEEQIQSWYENTYKNYFVDKSSFIDVFKNKTIEWKTTIAIIRSNRRGIENRNKSELNEVENRIKGEK